MKTALLALIVSFLALPAISQIDKSNYALLWEISGNGLEKSSYLFGTMHLRDDRVFEFPDSLLLTLDQCEAFANETRLDSTICNLLQMYEFGDTSNFLKNYLPEYTYNKVNKALFEKTGLYIEMLDIKEPQRIETILSDHDFEYYKDDRDAELDYFLFQRAYEQGKPLYGLEQEMDYKKLSLSYFDEFEYNYQPLGDTTGKKEFMDNLLDHYRSGNLDSIGKFAVTETFVSNYDYQFINGRNKEMVQSMLPLMQKHSVFVAIGAAHLPGEEGVIQLLKKEGFTLRKVEAKFSNLPISPPENKVSPEWMLTTNKKDGYQFATPGKPFKVVPAKAGEKITQEAFYYFDIPTQSTFSARTRLYPYINSGISKEEAMMTEARLWAFKRAISKDPAEMNLKLKDFYSGSHTGKETLIEIDENTVNRMVIFLEKNTLFMFVAEGSRENVFNEKANRFFESIVIQPAKETNWQTFTSKAGGFSIDMPEEPSEEIFEIPYDIGTDLNIRAKVFLSKDLEKGDTYMVRYLDYPVGIGIVEDSSFYQSQVDEILARYQLPETKPEIVYLSGIKFLKLDILYNQLRLVFWVGYQGNRSYLLMVVPSIGPESQNEDYNNWYKPSK
ncbi:MAG: TraB/GumN family protein [Saprospiraceae bacterium]